jgi:hypothetical protein
MHKLKPGGVGSSGGMQMVWDSAPDVQPFPSHARANVCQYEETTFAGTVGPEAQTFSVIVSGSIVREWAAPWGIWVVLSQSPSQVSGALNEVRGPA